MGIVMLDFALGGTERIAVRLANSWTELGVEVEVFCGNPAGPMRDLLHPAVRVRQPATIIPRGRGALRRLGAAAQRHFARFPVHAVYIPGNTHWPIVQPLTVLPLPQRPLVIAQISAALHKPQRGAFRQMLFERRTRHWLATADHVVGLCGEAARQAAAMLGRTDIAMIPLPALDDTPTIPASCTTTEPLIFAASRLVRGKGLEHLLRAFAQAAHPTARLVIAGSGPERRSLQGLSQRLGLDQRVEWLGYQPDIRPWLERARFFAFPSDHEGYGATIIEALAAGRPVLATDCSPAVKELLGTANAGLVIPVGDVAAMARGIAELLERSEADPVALAAGVERFRIGPVARRYLGLVGILPGRDGSAARLLAAANDAKSDADHCREVHVAL